MKAPHRVLSAASLLVAVISLSQCALPPQQAWRYIQSNGLLTYMRHETGHASPPFGTRASHPAPRYAASSAPVPRYSAPLRPSSSSLGSGRSSYGPTFSSPGYAENRYYRPAPKVEAPRPRTRSAPAKPRSGSDSIPPRVKIPVEEPAPRIANNTPAPSTTSSGSSAAGKSDPVADLPYGSVVAGRVNMVNSPYAGKTQLVDVSGMSAGQTVKCPYTGKLFKVPAAQQAQNKVESKTEAPETKPEAGNP